MCSPPVLPDPEDEGMKILRNVQDDANPQQRLCGKFKPRRTPQATLNRDLLTMTRYWTWRKGCCWRPRTPWTGLLSSALRGWAPVCPVASWSPFSPDTAPAMTRHLALQCPLSAQQVVAVCHYAIDRQPAKPERRIAMAASRVRAKTVSLKIIARPPPSVQTEGRYHLLTYTLS